jgi:hypothetical protein
LLDYSRFEDVSSYLRNHTPSPKVHWLFRIPTRRKVMKNVLLYQGYLIALVTAGFLTNTMGQNLTGSATLTLSAPATEEQKAAADQAATDSLRNALYLWVQENIGQTPNISNSVEKKLFNTFAKTCVRRAKSSVTFEGHDLIVEYAIEPGQIRAAIGAHNEIFDSLTLGYYTSMRENLKYNQLAKAFTLGVQALYNSKAHIGDPLKTPRDSANFLQFSIQSATQQLLNKISIQFSEPVLKGKPSEPIMNNITVKVLIDSTPLAGLPILCQLPNGLEVLTITTDSQGHGSLDKMKMPFVAYGTFLNARPNFGAIADAASGFVPASDLGLTLQEGQDQMLIFNIVKPVYTLNYQVSAVNKLNIPKDFQESTKFEQFLQDSLHMQPSAGGQAGDISINLQCQITSYASDETEQTKLKTEVHAILRQLKPGGMVIDETKIINEKEYAHSNDVQSTVIKKKKKGEEERDCIPTGDYFWETTFALRVFIRDLLQKL